ncbi:MAG TPA: lipase maturation factor family protein [Bryobacteraceae bacterium]
MRLVRPDGSATAGARAVFELLGRKGIYESSRVVAWVSEAAYRFIARHRNLFYWITRLTFGSRIEPSRFARTQWIFLRLLAAIYMIAFASLAAQMLGLIGSRGITPAQDYLRQVAASVGPVRYVALPTVFWWDSSDRILEVAAYFGMLFSILAFFGRRQRVALIVCWILYLSFMSVTPVFLGFQWDELLLESGFLAIFFARSAWGLRVVAWLYRCLVFRLYFLSGYVKLGSHDPTWANLTALQYHFHTQPLPTVIAWYADKLSRSILRAGTFGALAIELGAPFLIFAPRRLRQAGAWAMLALQILIFVTGNYAYFNLLTMALVVFLFDDQALSFVSFRRWAGSQPIARPSRAGKLVYAVLTVLLLTLGISRIFETVEGGLPEPLLTLAGVAAPFQIANGYGLFAKMTQTRPEIVVEGSDDGEHWQPYEFRYKPGPLDRAPRWVQPYQPRLDWQMWFAALGSYRDNPWFVGFVLRLLQGSPEVLGLLESNPFPLRPPRLIHAEVYEYSFSDWETRRRTGAWWQRRFLGEYLPAVGLREQAGGTP